MATSGTATKTFSKSGYFRLRAVWKENSQNVGGNSSNVTVTLYLDSISGYGSISDATNSGTSITINGNTYSWSTTSSVGANGTKTLGSHTVNIPHNSDGTKTFSFSAVHNVDITWSGSYIGTVTVSGTGTLDTIARKSTVSLNKASTDIGTQVRITIGRASTAFTHTLTYDWGGNIGTIASKINYSQHDWTVPTSFYSILKNATSGWGTIHVETFNGSTSLGKNSVKLTTTVPSNIVPSIGSITAVEANTAITSKVAMGTNIFIQGMSYVTFTMGSVSAGTGATISTYRFNFDNWDQYGGTAKTFKNPTGTGTKTVTAYVTDSRGRTASRTLNVTLVAYSAPTISSVTAVRSDGGIGTRVAVTRKGTISSLSSKNKYTTMIQSGPKGGAMTTDTASTSTGAAGATAINLTNTLAATFAITNSYTITVTVSDLFNTASSVAIISTASALMDLGLTGVGFGKIHEGQAAVEVTGGVIIDHYMPQKVPANGNLNNYTTPGFYYNNTDADTATILNTPTNNAFSLEVFRHAGHRQVFRVYLKDTPLTYERNLYGGIWGRWILTSGNVGGALGGNNGWSFYGGSYMAPQYWVTGSDMVHIGGLIDYGTKTAGIQVATIPVGYRPASREMFHVYGYNKPSLRVDVTPEGYVLLMDAPLGFVSLSGISFRKDWYQ